MENQLLDENTTLNDNAIALKIAVDSSASCQNFTNKTMLNPSPDYAYANNPGLYACSSELVRTALGNSTPVISCNFISNQSSCPFYSPDYSVILKSSLTAFNQTLDYYLSRFRAFDGSYFYKIYDSTGKIFFDLNYTNISNSNGQVDEEAKLVFHQFLNESFETQDYLVQDLSKNSNVKEEEQKNNKSYLNSLIS